MAFTLWRRARLNALGTVVLLAGVGIGGLLYQHARVDEAPSDDDVLFEQEQSKAYQREVERNVGAVGALMAHWDEALEGLGKPRPLAVTIMVVSCAAAAGCFWVASRQPE